MKLKVYTDGGARGNPGPAAIGIVIKGEQGETIFSSSRFLGTKTNNEAEYMGLIAGLMAAQDKEGTDVECFMDSELVVRQMQGAYKVKMPHLKSLWQKAKELESEFKSVSYTHITSGENSEADALLNAALDNV